MNAVQGAQMTNGTRYRKAVLAVVVTMAVCLACGKSPEEPGVEQTPDPKGEPNGGAQVTLSSDSVVLSMGDGSLLFAAIRNATGPVQYVSRNPSGNSRHISLVRRPPRMDSREPRCSHEATSRCSAAADRRRERAFWWRGWIAPIVAPCRGLVGAGDTERSPPHRHRRTPRRADVPSGGSDHVTEARRAIQNPRAPVTSAAVWSRRSMAGRVPRPPRRVCPWCPWR